MAHADPPAVDPPGADPMAGDPMVETGAGPESVAGPGWLVGAALSRPARMLRLIMIVAGAVGLLVGLQQFVAAVPGPQLFQWTRAIGWGVAGLLITDGVLWPLAALLGAVALPRLPARQRPVARGVLLAAGCLGLVALIVVGARTHRQNPTAVANAPSAGLLAGAALILGAVVVAELVALRRRPDR